MKKLIIATLIMALLLCGTNALASVMVITGTPTYDESEAMDRNLSLAIDALNGLKIEKGKTYSFNEIVGARVEVGGFMTAPNGNGSPVIGGGVSQVATTLYLALKELGDEITFDERHTFGSAFNADYVDDARDTALTDYARGLDFKFSSKAVEDLVVSMWEGGGTLFCQLTDAGIAVETPAETPASTATPDTPALDETWLTVVNCNTSVSLRERPSKQADKLADVVLGEKVKDLGERENSFSKVEYEGQVGYILSKYLE